MHCCKVVFSWRNFATIVKHNRHEISVKTLIASPDVEEKARVKDTTKNEENQSSINVVQKKSYGRTKGTANPFSTSL
jgi:hypothetical protein